MEEQIESRKSVLKLTGQQWLTVLIGALFLLGVAGLFSPSPSADSHGKRGKKATKLTVVHTGDLRGELAPCG